MPNAEGSSSRLPGWYRPRRPTHSPRTSRGAVKVLVLPVPSLPLVGARDLCRAQPASFGLVLRPRGLPPRPGPRCFGPREGLRRSPGRSPAPRALESGSWVSRGLRRASPGDFTAWPSCVCVWWGGRGCFGREASALRGRVPKPAPKEKTAGWAHQACSGPGKRKRAWRGPRAASGFPRLPGGRGADDWVSYPR